MPLRSLFTTVAGCVTGPGGLGTSWLRFVAGLAHGGVLNVGAGPTCRWAFAGGVTRTRGASGSERRRAAMSSPPSLPEEIRRSAGLGELPKVVKWLRKGGLVDAFTCRETADGRKSTETLMHAAAANGHLELVRELLKRGASVDLPTGLGVTALMSAAGYGHVSVLHLLLQHSASPNLQDVDGFTALMRAATLGHAACMQELLRAGTNAELLDNKGRTALLCAEIKGHTRIAALLRQHAAPPQPAAARAPAAPPVDEPAPVVNEPAPVESSPASLPLEYVEPAIDGELRGVLKWLRKGGRVDASCSTTTDDGRVESFTLLQTAAANGHLEMVRELLKRGASVDLPSILGVTALMEAASNGHLSVMLLLLQHSADPDLQDTDGETALDKAANLGQEAGKACVQALLRAKITAEINRHDAAAASQAAHAEQAARAANAEQAAYAEQAAQAAQAARAMLAARQADATMNKLLAEEAAEQAKAQAPSKKSKKKKKNKAGRAGAAGYEPSEAPPATATASPPVAAPEPAVSAAARAEAVLWAAIAGGGLSTLEAALAVAPREVREGGVGAEARARRDRLVETQQEAEREAKQEAAAEAARLAAAERAGEAMARAAAVSKAREEAAAAASAAAAAVEAAAAAAAKIDALEREMATEGGEAGGSGAAGPSEASAAAEVPDDYICPITSEIMTDPVSTLDGFTYERAAITEWLCTKDTSPKTGAKLESKALIPNHSLRSVIRSFVEASAAIPPPPPPA